MPLLAGITFVDYIQVSWGEKEKFEGTNGVIRSRKQKDRQYNRQKKKTNNDLQNITQTTKVPN